MPKEIQEQIISGSPMNEKECFGHLIEHLGQSRDASRGLAHLRGDIRWLAIAGILDEVRDKAQRLLVAGTGLILPPKH